MSRSHLVVHSVMLALTAVLAGGAARAATAAGVVEGTAFIRGDARGVPCFLAPGDGPRPLLVHIQGSGCEPVFVADGAAHVATAGQDLVHTLADGRFAVLVADKVGVEPFNRLADADGTAGNCSEDFLGRHSLDNWTRRLGMAIDAAMASGHVDSRAGVRVLGLSEGAIAAASGPESNTIFEGQTHLFWSTFGRACPAMDLAASESDVFLAYGTADEEVDAGGVEAITAARIAARKPVRVERIIGASHVLDTPGTEPFEVLVGVFAAAIEWMTPD